MPSGSDAARAVADAEKVIKARYDFLKVGEVFSGHKRFRRDQILRADDAPHGGQSLFDQLGVVVGDRRRVVERQFETCAIGRRHFVERLPHQLYRARSHLFIERAHRAFKLHLSSDDVVAVAAMNRADGDDERFEWVNATAANGLQSGHAFGSDDDRIGSEVRLRAMRFFAANEDGEAIR